ncbi:hypothetical protein EVAR_24151_1 [Eumeta japonica]|uniref:Uncharacterized protein n=1 Tax=Eumeta variegata TaxID=151549 RepID=A0A4C1YRB7_EUMVA|nr:hypothetical protein EVAR_24151_1 [Eumeta japonica]
MRITNTRRASWHEDAPCWRGALMQGALDKTRVAPDATTFFLYSYASFPEGARGRPGYCEEWTPERTGAGAGATGVHYCRLSARTWVNDDAAGVRALANLTRMTPVKHSKDGAVAGRGELHRPVCDEFDTPTGPVGGVCRVHST